MADLSGTSKKRPKQPPFDAVRSRLKRLLRSKKIPVYTMSRKLGKNQTYLHYYIYKGVPEDLDLASQNKIAKALRMPTEKVFAPATEQEIADHLREKGQLLEAAAAATPQAADGTEKDQKPGDQVASSEAPEVAAKASSGDMTKAAKKPKAAKTPKSQNTAAEQEPNNTTVSAPTAEKPAKTRRSRNATKPQKPFTPQTETEVAVQSVIQQLEHNAELVEANSVVILAPVDFVRISKTNEPLPDEVMALKSDADRLPLHFEIEPVVLRAGANISVNKGLPASGGELAVLSQRQSADGVAIATIVRAGSESNLASFTVNFIGEPGEESLSRKDYVLTPITSIEL